MANIIRTFSMANMTSRWKCSHVYSPLDVEKYVSKEEKVNDGFIKPSTQLKMNLYLEIEKQRRKNCESNGKTELFKMTSWCASSEVKSGGEGAICRKHSIMSPRCPIYCTIQSCNSTPYSVVISDNTNPNVSIDFQPGELIALLTIIKKIFKKNTEEDLTVDVPVWGGRDTLRITRNLEDYCDEGCECPYYGIAMGQINFKINRKRIRDVGYNEKIIPTVAVESLYISHENVNRFIYIMEKTSAVLQLQWEIRAQNFATFRMVSKKINENPKYTKEEYYWFVMDSFFSLDVSDNNKLPAYFVIRDFFKKYLCQKYSLYSDEVCICDQCVALFVKRVKSSTALPVNNVN